MYVPYEYVIFGTAVLLGAIGAGSVVASLRCRRESARLGFQRLFVTCLVGVGAATMLALPLQSNCWLSCAIAYACLAIGATIDTQRSARPESAHHWL